MVIKVYVAMITCSQEIKKNQQRAIMILESKNIPYIAIDITDPGNEESKDYMAENSVPKEGCKIAVTPQLFNEADYCGDYDGLDMANECDTLGDFLKLNDSEKAAVKIGITGIGPKNPNQPQEEKTNLTNGVTASREDAVEITPEVLENTPAEETKPAEETPAEPKDTEETPVLPETASADPESTPAEPETTTTEPETTPVEPESAPAEPETTPAEPETAPAEPETAPAEPETTPAAPEATPSDSEAIVPKEEDAASSEEDSD